MSVNTVRSHVTFQFDFSRFHAHKMHGELISYAYYWDLHIWTLELILGVDLSSVLWRWIDVKKEKTLGWDEVLPYRSHFAPYTYGMDWLPW